MSEDPNQPETPSLLERAVLWHLCAFVLLATWFFGGNSPGGRLAVGIWGTVGIVLTAAIVARARGPRILRPLWPLALFDLLALIALANPSFRLGMMDGDAMLIPVAPFAWAPSTARPAIAASALWILNGIYLSCFNLSMTATRRRTIRRLLLVAAVNALALAVFGTLQRLAGSSGLYFGSVPSPQVRFFSTFVYHNHWGAFAVLMTALSLGLIFRYGRHREYLGFWNSPAFAGLVGVVLLAASIPLSTSRSCTLLVIALLGGAFLHFSVQTVRHRRKSRRSPFPKLAAAAAALALALGAGYWVAGDTIAQRIAKTREQVAQIQQEGSIGRLQLYRDTWHMAQDRIVFGWGMGSYPTVFTLYNTRKPNVDRLPVFYEDAHSDWLQSLAEHGFVGTVLLGLMGLVPLASLKGRRIHSPIPGYLLTGCALVLLYAWVEFPFGNVAVVFCWWLCFFSAIRYIELRHSE